MLSFSFLFIFVRFFDVNFSFNFRCYLCAQKFILPQELSRHIRDKVCKTENKPPDDDVCHDEDDLNSMSLLELPIIEDMSQDDGVTTDLIVTSQSDPSTSEEATTVETFHENYLIIEHATELELAESHEQLKHKAGSSSEVEQKILWGCKQCEFR